MKKIALTISLSISLLGFAQKDEIKTLRKISDKKELSAVDYQLYLDAVGALKQKAVSEDDHIALKYYDAMTPVAEIATKTQFPQIENLQNLLKPENFNKLISNMKEILAYEDKTGIKNYTNEILKNRDNLKNVLRSASYKYNQLQNYRDASDSFYKIYQLDSSDKSYLENAAITALQSQQYELAEKIFREMKVINYYGGGINYNAKSKINGKEELFVDKNTRDNAVKLGTHESPRDVTVPARKEEYTKILAELAVTNKNYEQAKLDYKDAKSLMPNNIEVLTNEANLYYNTGDKTTYNKLIQEILTKDPNNAQLNYNIAILALEEDNKLVEEINKNLKDKVKYDQLSNKRKDMFMKVLPFIEKAYQIEPTNNDYKSLLKSTYEIVGMKDKAAKIN